MTSSPTAIVTYGESLVKGIVGREVATFHLPAFVERVRDIREQLSPPPTGEESLP